MAAYAQLSATLGNFEDRLKSKRVSFEVLKALTKANDEGREKALAAIFAGTTLAARDIENVSREVGRRWKPDFEILQMKALDTLRQEFERRIPNGAKLLYEAMKTYLTLGSENREAGRTRVMELAQNLLADIVFIHGDISIPMEDWAHVELDDPLKRKFAEGHYAVKEIAAGNFVDKFPAVFPSGFRGPDEMLAKMISPWRSEESIWFLTGETEVSVNEQRVSAKRRLSAIEICSGIGGLALGLRAAGFNLKGLYDCDPDAINVLRANRPEWNSKPLDIKKHKGQFFDEVETLLSNGSKLDLLAGALPWKHWDRGKVGAKDPADLFDVIEEFVTRFRPNAFLFETVDGFRGPDHLYHFREFGTKYKELGYEVEIFAPDYADFGIVENRDKIFLVGIQRDFAENFRLPLPTTLKHEPIGKLMWNSVFAECTRPTIVAGNTFRLSGPLGPRVPPAELQKILDTRAKHQAAFDKWAVGWLKDFGHHTSIPPLARGLKYWSAKRPTLPDSTATFPVEAAASQKRKRGRPAIHRPRLDYKIMTNQNIDRRWKAYGIEVDARELALPKVDGAARGNVGLSIPLLKEFLGLPQNWKMIGNKELIFNQLCEATPPKIALAVGSAIHQALTGGINSLDPRQDAISTMTRSWFPSPAQFLERYQDPKRKLANLWREGILAMKSDVAGNTAADQKWPEDDLREESFGYDYKSYLSELSAMIELRKFQEREIEIEAAIEKILPKPDPKDDENYSETHADYDPSLFDPH